MTTAYTPIPAGQQDKSAVKNNLKSLSDQAAELSSQGVAAWCRFSGTAAAPTVQAGRNVRKVEKMSTGVFRVWFSTALDSTNCATVASAAEASPIALPMAAGCRLHRTDCAEIMTARISGAVLADPEVVTLIVMGTLAEE